MRIERTTPRDKSADKGDTNTSRSAAGSVDGGGGHRSGAWNLYPFTPESINSHVAFLDAAFDRDGTDSIEAISSLLQRTRNAPSPLQLLLDGHPQPMAKAVPFAHINRYPETASEVPLRPLRHAEVRPPLLLPHHVDGQFPLATAETLAALSDEVYQPVVDVAHRLRRNPFVTHARAFDDGGAQAIGLVYDGRPVLVFRGTDLPELADWRHNLKIGLKPIARHRPDLRVHAGFSDYLQILWPAIEAWRETLPAGLGGWLLSGHSLGGAMATLAAWRLQDSGQSVEALVSFGAPPVGSAEFRSHCESRQLAARVWRVVAGPDIVPMSLPRHLGYSHVGTLISLAESWHSDETFLAQCLGSIQSPGVLMMGAQLHTAFPVAASIGQLAVPVLFRGARGLAAHMNRFGYAQSLSTAMAIYAHQALAKAALQPQIKTSKSGLVQRHTDLARLWIRGCQ